MATASTDSEIEPAIARHCTGWSRRAAGRTRCVLQQSARRQLTSLAAKHKLPAIYNPSVSMSRSRWFRELLERSFKDGYRQAGVLAGKILAGANPAEQPVTQPTKFEFVVNLQTAKALGLTLPPAMLALADEVIE